MGSNDLVAITGIALTFVVSAANLIFTLRNNRQTIFVNTVSASRLKWIDSLRDEVSEFIAVSARLGASDPSAADNKLLLLQRDKLLHQMILHLNPVDQEDQKIKSLANRVCELTDHHEKISELNPALVELRDAAGIYLKKEWNRVKAESAGVS